MSTFSLQKYDGEMKNIFVEKPHHCLRSVRGPGEQLDDGNFDQIDV